MVFIGKCKNCYVLIFGLFIKIIFGELFFNLLIFLDPLNFEELNNSEKYYLNLFRNFFNVSLSPSLSFIAFKISSISRLKITFYYKK